MALKDQAWEPQLYKQFETERAQPATDLLNRIHLKSQPKHIIDLGCGAGNEAKRMAERWPEANVLGVDSSKEMLAENKKLKTPASNLTWQCADINSFVPSTKVDLIFSNAALQWLDGHDELFPRFLSWLKPNGILAVQMPMNFSEPSHTQMAELARSNKWASKMSALKQRTPVSEPSYYYELINSRVRKLDIWETTYTHVLEGDDPVAHWTRSTGLRPYLSLLQNEQEKEEFFDDYKALLRCSYPKQSDGRTLFPFKRFFMLAEK